MKTIDCGGGTPNLPDCNCPPPAPAPMPGLRCEDVAQCPIIMLLSEGLEKAEGDIAAIQGDIVTINGQISDAQVAIQANSDAILVLQGDVSTLQSDVSAAQSDIITLQQDVQTAQAAADQAQSDATQAGIDAFAAQTTANSALYLAEMTQFGLAMRCLEGIGEGYTLVDYASTGVAITPGANNAYLVKAPWRIAGDPAAMYLRIGSGALGAVGRVAIYDATGPLYNQCTGPGNLIWEQGGTFSAATSGAIITIPLPPLGILPGQPIFVVVAVSSAAVTFTGFSAASKRIVSSTGLGAFRRWAFPHDPTTAFGPSPTITSSTDLTGEMFIFFA